MSTYELIDRAARRMRLPLAALALLALAPLADVAEAAVQITGSLRANVQDFGQIRLDNGGPITHLPLDQTSMGTLNGNWNGGSQSIDASVASTLSSSVIAIGATMSNASASGSGSVIGTSGGGLLTVEDEFLITSTTLAAGTPVNLHFSFYSVRAGTFAHDSFGDPGGDYGGNNGTGIRYQFTGQVSSWPAAFGSQVGFQNWSGGDHFLIEDGLLGPSTQSGLFDPATPQYDFVVGAEVGGTVDVRFRLEARIGVGTWSTGTGNVEVRSGQANAGVSVAFGASAALPDVAIESALYGGPFSAASQANFSNANMALSSFTPIPLPPMALPMVLSLVMLARLRRA